MYIGDKVKNVFIAMYSPCVSLIKKLFVNAKIIIDWFHIVNLFTNYFNHTSHLIIFIFLNAFILKLVYYMMMILLILVLMLIRLKKNIWMVSIFEGRYWENGFELLTFHLKYFKDKVSNIININRYLFLLSRIY